MTTDLVTVPPAELDHRYGDEMAEINAAIRKAERAIEAYQTAGERAKTVVDECRVTVAVAAGHIKDGKLYRAAGYQSLRAWHEGDGAQAINFVGSLSHLYHLAKSGPVMEDLSQKGFGINERQARELISVPEERRVEVVTRASSMGRITAASIATVAARYRHVPESGAATIDEPEEVEAEVVDEWVTCPHCGGTGKVRA